MFLSFIIPVYNTEKYLDSCISSLINQDLPHSDYEIICVNDGSTDYSLDVLRKWELKSENVVVLDQKNSGVCIARNNGLDRAAGDYIWFIDSDDLIQENILFELKERVYEGRYDRVIIGNYYFDTEVPYGEMKKNTAWQDSVVWRSIFRREYLLKNNLRFHYQELVYGEDALFMYEIKRFFPSTIELKNPYYFHRGRPGSAGCEDANMEIKLKKIRANLMEAKVMQKYYEQENVLPETADRLMSFLWGTLYRIAELPADDAKKYLAELKKYGLYPYKRPAECTITKTGQLNRNDFVETLFDKIYTNLNTVWGYHAMRSWFSFFELKQKISSVMKDM